MKKTVVFILVLFLLISLFTFNCYGVENNFDFDEVWEQTDDRTRDYLEELGITEVSFDELFSLTPTRVINFLTIMCFSTGTEIFKNVTLIIVILIISAIASSFLKDSDKMENVIYFVTTLTVISVVIVPISRIVTDAASGIKTSTVFINSYLPIMCSIVIASQKPALAFTYNSFSVFLSSAIANFADNFFVPVIGALLSLNILSSFSFENYRDRLIKTIRRMVIVVLSLFSTVFTGLITTQSILANSTDSVTMKGIKFLSGTFVPVVGGGVGEALSSVFGSFVLMKNTLGVFVIGVILLLNLPVIIELLIWYFALGFCSIISSMFSLKYITDVIDNLASVISLLNIIVFFITFILVISTGIIIIMGK